MGTSSNGFERQFLDSALDHPTTPAGIDASSVPSVGREPPRCSLRQVASEPELPLRMGGSHQKLGKARDSGKLGGEQFYNFSLVHLRPGVGRKTIKELRAERALAKRAEILSLSR